MAQVSEAYISRLERGQRIASPVVRQSLARALGVDPEWLASGQGSSRAERERPEAHRYADHAGMQVYVVGDLDAAMGPTTPKLVIVAAPEKLEGLLPEVRGRWAGRLNVATSTADYLEFTSVESDKASALRFVSERLGVARSEVVAVGDGRNDASMIAWAGLGIAIEGSPQEVIAAADRTIPGPGHGGIQQLADALLK